MVVSTAPAYLQRTYVCEYHPEKYHQQILGSNDLGIRGGECIPGILGGVSEAVVFPWSES